jgi:hypothetical protein
MQRKIRILLKLLTQRQEFRFAQNKSARNTFYNFRLSGKFFYEFMAGFYVAATFTELSKLAKWDGTSKVKDPPPEEEHRDENGGGGDGLTFKGRLGLSYTINLNLPATTDIDVFNAIFKSLRENLLREQ